MTRKRDIPMIREIPVSEIQSGPAYVSPRFDKVKELQSWSDASESVRAEFAEEMNFAGYNADFVLTKWLEKA